MFRTLEESNPMTNAYHVTLGALLVAASAVPIATWVAALLLAHWEVGDRGAAPRGRHLPPFETRLIGISSERVATITKGHATFDRLTGLHASSGPRHEGKASREKRLWPGRNFAKSEINCRPAP
jgi:hypothetical protein